MTDLSLPPVPNTEELAIVLNLTDWAALYDLSTASFIARICDARGGALTRYEWKSGGSAEFPNGILAYDTVSKVMVLRAVSSDVLAAFPPSLIAQRGGSFVWELGFYLPSDTDKENLIGIGDGSFTVENGVIV